MAKKYLTIGQVVYFLLWFIATGIAFFGWIFVLNAEGKLDIKKAIDYTTFSMAFIGLSLSLLATFFSLVAYYDGKTGLNRLVDKIDKMSERLPASEYVKEEAKSWKREEEF